MKIITGATGTPHITAADDGELNRGIFGDTLVVLSNGTKMNAIKSGALSIQVQNGSCVFQGRHAVIENSETVNFISAGTSGGRTDLICVQYYKDVNSGLETMSLEVIRGTVNSSEDPSYQSIPTIPNGGTTVQAPLYRVRILGSDIQSIERIAKVVPYLVDTAGRKIGSGTSLPSGTSDYQNGDIFLVYE